MADEPTAWEDINPPMVSAPQQGQLSTCSDPEARTVFRNELTACLALTAPVGMTEESRREWLAVAWDTLKHLPPDILAIGARAARRQCDHPARIVPAIIAETAELMHWRKEARRRDREDEAPRLPEPDRVTPEEIAQIKAEIAAERERRHQAASG